MTKYKLGQIGGVLILISMLFPISYISWVEYDYESYSWLFGIFYFRYVFNGTEHSEFYFTLQNLQHVRYSWEYMIIMLTIVFSCTILVAGILIIISSTRDNGKNTLICAILSIIAIIGYVFTNDFLFCFLLEYFETGVICVPRTYYILHIGFYGILIGGILSMIGGIKSLKEL